MCANERRKVPLILKEPRKEDSRLKSSSFRSRPVLLVQPLNSSESSSSLAGVSSNCSPSPGEIRQPVENVVLDSRNNHNTMSESPKRKRQCLLQSPAITPPPSNKYNSPFTNPPSLFPSISPLSSRISQLPSPLLPRPGPGDTVSHSFTKKSESDGSRPKVFQENSHSVHKPISTHEKLTHLIEEHEKICNDIKEISNDRFFKFVCGFYCQVCEKLVQGGVSNKEIHQESEMHIKKLNEFEADPEKLMDQYEKQYDGLVFEDDCPSSGDNNLMDIGPTNVTRSIRDDEEESITHNNACSDKIVDNSSSDSDNEGEEHKERYDRTKMTKK